MISMLEDRKTFIEDGIGSILSVKRDFDSIKYAKTNVTGKEIIRINDIFGRVAYIDVTGESLEKIVDDMFRIALMGSEKVSAPTGYISDMEEVRKLAPLFR